MTEQEIHDTHPIESISRGGTSNYVLPTIDQINFNKFVYNILETRSRGGMIVAESGIGKTTAIKNFINNHNAKNNNDFATVYASMSANDYVSEKRFFLNLISCFAKDLDRSFVGGEAIKNQYMAYIANLAMENNGTVVLFLDEAQHMKEKEYQYLKNVVNELKESELQANIKTILVGTKELRSKKLSFIRTSKNQIIKRFMLEELELQGINTLSRFSLFLEAYDKQVYCNQTYTEHYFPIAVQKGCRLASFSNDIWEMFKTMGELSMEPKLTMEDACTFVEYIFRHFGKYAKDESKVSEWITEDIIKESINETSLLFKLKYYEEQEMMQSGTL